MELGVWGLTLFECFLAFFRRENEEKTFSIVYGVLKVLYGWSSSKCFIWLAEFWKFWMVDRVLKIFHSWSSSENCKAMQFLCHFNIASRCIVPFFLTFMLTLHGWTFPQFLCSFFTALILGAQIPCAQYWYSTFQTHLKSPTTSSILEFFLSN